MNLSSFEMIELVDNPGQYQCLLEFNETTQLSVITGRGTYTNTDTPYEIAVFVNGDFAKLPGITDDKKVRGYMTESDVDLVIKKLYTLTNKLPTQV